MKRKSGGKRAEGLIGKEGDFSLLTNYFHFFTDGLLPGASGLHALSPKERSGVVMASRVFSKTIAPEKRTIFTQMKIFEKPHELAKGLFDSAARLDCENLNSQLKREKMEAFIEFAKKLSIISPRFSWRAIWGIYACQSLFFINGRTYCNKDDFHNDGLLLVDSAACDSKGRLEKKFLKDWIVRLKEPVTIEPDGWKFANEADGKRIRGKLKDARFAKRFFGRFAKHYLENGKSRERAFEGWFWSKGLVENDKMLNELYGHEVDLKLKRELGTCEYYSNSSSGFNASFAIPIDMEDLRKLQFNYPKAVIVKKLVGGKMIGDVWVGGKFIRHKLSQAEIRKSCCREAWIETDLGRFRLQEWQVESIAKKYPGKCGKCGYSRFCYLELVLFGIGSEATLRCPYCGKKTELNWKNKW